jgi:tetratricopeptide (TPR) repeat protein
LPWGKRRAPSTSSGGPYRNGSSYARERSSHLGQFLIRERLVTEEQLFKALLAQEEKGRLLGSILTSEGVLDEEDLRLALHAKATETIYDLFLWPEGQFEFKEGEFPHDVLISFEMPATPVIMEGMRRVDEWARIREVFPTMETTLQVKGPSHVVEDPYERQALGLVAAGKTLTEMSLEMRRSEFDTADLCYRLYQRGLVVVDQTREESKAPDPIGAIQALLGLAYQRLQEKRYDAAIKAYEEVLALDRLNQHAKKGLIATIEARTREKAVRSVPLTKVPVLSMDLIALTKEDFDPHEGFVLSRVNGEWDVQSILKLCPMGEEAALLIFSRLLERKAIALRDPEGTKGSASTNDGR